MNIPFNDLSRRFENSEKMQEELKEFVITGPYLNGPILSSFEMKFAEYLGVKYCVGVSSGTAALQLAMLALDLPSNSKILLPANAGGYSTIAALNCKLVPVFYDIDDNGLPNLEQLSEFMDVEISAIVVTHLYGQTCDMPEILKIATQFNWKVIEDCAQSTGSIYVGKSTGSFGDIAAFSFYPTKNLGAIGDAGAVVTNSTELCVKAKQLREYGWIQKYQVGIANGGNFRMDDIQALILNHQIDRLDLKNARRRSIWNYYTENLRNSQAHLIGKNDNSFVAHLAVLRTTKRKEFLDFLGHKGIQTQIHYPIPDHLQPGWSFPKLFNLGVTETFSKEILSIPLFPEMYDAEIEYVAETLLDCSKNV